MSCSSHRREKLLITTYQEVISKDPRFTNESLAFLQIVAQNAALNNGPPEVDAMRQNFEQLHVKCNAKLNETFKGTLTEQTIKTSSTDLPISIYTPIHANKDKLGIFFHGGGWVVGSRKSHQTLVNYIADTTKTIWISVEYRLGPEHKFPIWLDDATDATEYILKNKTKYGVNETAKVGVAGDSAGGMIAASIARMVKGLDFQILIYPALDLFQQTGSYKEFVDPQYFLTPELMQWFQTNGFRSRDDYQDLRVSALLNTSFESLPPCLFIVAELDVLRDGSLEYQKLLDQAGIKTNLVLVKGALHGFFSLFGIYPQACAVGFEAVRDFLGSL